MKSEKQSVVFFEKKGWTENKAIRFLKAHNLHPIKHVDKHLKGELRYRLNDPKKYDHFTTIKTKLGINYILGWLP